MRHLKINCQVYFSRHFLNEKFSNHALMDSKTLNQRRASNKSNKRNSITVTELIKQTLSACPHISV